MQNEESNVGNKSKSFVSPKSIVVISSQKNEDQDSNRNLTDQKHMK